MRCRPTADGLGSVFLPPCGPELQPAARLWPPTDEPVAMRCLASPAELGAAVPAPLPSR